MHAPIADTSQLDAVARRILSTGPSPFGVPGLVVVAHGATGAEAVLAVGVDAAGRAMAVDRPFPLASATKLATGLLVLRLVEDGALALDAPLAPVLPDAVAGDGALSIRDLLSHRGGLPLDLPPGAVAYGPTLDWPAVRRACLRVGPVAVPRTVVRYSNVGFGLLGIAAERVTGMAFGDALREVVLDRLAPDARFGEPRGADDVAIADVRSPFVGTAAEPYNSDYWHALALPWASLSASPRSLLRLLEAYRPGTPGALLADGLAHEAVRDQTAPLGGGFPGEAFLGFDCGRPLVWERCDWGLSVEVRGGKRPHWTPASVAPSSFGQIGSSGCLAWCDPTAHVSWAVVGARATDCGWLLRHGAALGDAALATVRTPDRPSSGAPAPSPVLSERIHEQRSAD